MEASHYRAMTFGGKGIVTQGWFCCIRDVVNYLTKRGLDYGAVLRVEREHNGKWIFEQNIVVPEAE